MENIAETVVLMEPNVSSILETMSSVLQSLKTIDEGSLNQFGYPIEVFFESVTETVLDWMGSGEIEQVRDLLEQMDRALRDEAEDIHCLDSLSLSQQLTEQLRCLLEIMAIFLRTDNLAKYVGLLVRKDNVTLSKALQWTYRRNKPTRPSDLVVKKRIVNNRQSAKQVLDRLVALDLLEQTTENIYALTWAGRKVGRIL